MDPYSTSLFYLLDACILTFLHATILPLSTSPKHKKFSTFTDKYQETKDQKAQQKEARKGMNNDAPMSCKNSCQATAESCEAIDDDFDLDDLDWSDDSFDQWYSLLINFP